MLSPFFDHPLDKTLNIRIIALPEKLKVEMLYGSFPKKDPVHDIAIARTGLVAILE